MHCHKCNSEYHNSVFLPRYKIILEFFPDNIVNETELFNFEWNDIALRKKIAEYVFSQLVSNENYITDYYSMHNRTYEKVIICKKCNETIFEDVLFSIESSIYIELRKFEINWLNNQFEEKYRFNPQKLIGCLNGDEKKLEFYIENSKIYFPENNNKIINIHKFICSLEHPERGGDGDWGVLQFLYEFVTNEFVKNALYDIIKYGITTSIGYFIARKRYKEIEKSSVEKMNEYVDDHLLCRVETDPSLLSYLSKSERKKICKKIAKMVTKEQYKIIRKAMDKA